MRAEVDGFSYYNTALGAGALMFVLARIDYSRFRELRVGIYTLMIFTITLVLFVARLLVTHLIIGVIAAGRAGPGSRARRR